MESSNRIIYRSLVAFAVLSGMLMMTAGCSNSEVETSGSNDVYTEVIDLPSLAQEDETRIDSVEETNRSVNIEDALSEGLDFISLGNGNAIVAGIGECTDNYIVIPPTTPDGDTVTEIDNGAFSDCTNITGIFIPNTITVIGSDAFMGCTSLQSVSMPDDLYSLGYCAFSGCTALESIVIPDGVTEISGGAFAQCESLTSVYLPQTVNTIGITSSEYDRPGAFQDCTNLTDINLPAGLEIIGMNTFKGCSSLASVTIPDSVTTIGYCAFQECGLTSVEIPESVINMYALAFSNCDRLVTANIHSHYLSRYMFSLCGVLSTVTLPEEGNIYLCDLSSTAYSADVFDDCNRFETINGVSPDEWVNSIGVRRVYLKVTSGSESVIEDSDEVLYYLGIN